MGEFSVKFRGVRGSYPTPEAEFLEIGGNTACIEVRAGRHLIILDAGTGIIPLGNELFKRHITSAKNSYDRTPIFATILLSHLHYDHIQGLNFFKPLNVIGSKINIFGHSDSLKEDIKSLLFEKTSPMTMNNLMCELNIHNLNDKEVLVFNDESDYPIIKTVNKEEDLKPQGEEVIVSMYNSTSHPKDGVLIYKISYKDKSLVYATDKESFVGGDKRLALFGRNTDLLIHDSQYTGEDYLTPVNPKQGMGHSTFEMTIEMQEATQAKQTAFFHFDPSYNDEKLMNIESFYKNRHPNVFLARENMEIELL